MSEGSVYIARDGVALVASGSGGIGAVVVEAFARAGCPGGIHLPQEPHEGRSHLCIALALG